MRRTHGKRAGMKRPRTLGAVLGSVGLAAALFLFVLPGRTYLEQRHSLAAAQTRVKVLADEDNRLAERAQKLQTDAEIERLAREQYGLVKPGEKAFAILTPPGPAASTPAASTPAAPAPKDKDKGSLPSRLWHDIQFWN